MITKISDTWDSGNHLTRFREIVKECVACEGTGYYEDNNICKECDGKGEIVYNE